MADDVIVNFDTASIVSAIDSASSNIATAINNHSLALTAALETQNVAAEELKASVEKLAEMTRALAVITEYWFKIGQAEAEEATKDAKIKFSLANSEELVGDPALIVAHNDVLAEIKTP